MALMGGTQYGHWHQTDGAGDEVRTIFILGFPPDVKERELQNLLRWWPGYEASQMSYKGDQPMGFALFSTAEMATTARDALQNLVFDAETNSTLRAEMAKKNLYIKRGVPGVSTDVALDHSKRMRTGVDSVSTGFPSAFALSTTPAWASQGYLPTAAPYDPFAGYSIPQIPQVQHVAHTSYAPVQDTKDNPPCNTLFVGNLGEMTSESELRGVFGSQPGFQQMKVLRQGKSTVCFIEFVDVTSAMLVHLTLQGAILLTSDRGGMRIQFSKNPFGKKKVGDHGAEGVGPAGSNVSKSNGVSE